MSLLNFAASSCDTTSVKLSTTCLPHPQANQSTLTTVLTIVFAITASVALLMIVISGFRYIVAHGDPNATAQAKNSIIYAVVGLIITMIAYTIVTFVVGKVG